MTHHEIDMIERRCLAATFGPWTTGQLGGYEVVASRVGSHWEDLLCGDNRHADAEFMASARSDIPALVAEVRRLQEKLLTAIERTQRSVHDYYYDKIRDMTIEIEQLHDQIGRGAISYAQCDSDRRDFAARCANGS